MNGTGATADPFSAERVVDLGWRQGAILGDALGAKATAHWERLFGSDFPLSPGTVWIVASHDCDVANWSLDTEPWVELLAACVIPETDQRMLRGRHPRILQLQHASKFFEDDGADEAHLKCCVNHRVHVSRAWLMQEAPQGQLGYEHVETMRRWLAKRYIRSAFPSTFDRRWCAKKGKKRWEKILKRHSSSIQDVYLSLNTPEELENDHDYVCDLVVCVPEEAMNEPEWASRREKIAVEIEDFWNAPDGIACGEVEILPLDSITLADLHNYQRFDADWISDADDSPQTPPATLLES